MMQEETIYKAQAQKEMRAEQRSGLALLLIGSGVLLLFATLFDVDMVAYVWPFFIIIPAVLMLRPPYKATEGGQSRWMFLAIPGSFFLTVGSLLLVMNLTDHFEAWAYSWTLLPSAVFAGIMYMKRFEPEHGIHAFGQKFIRAMLIAFFGLAIFFELIVFDTLGPWWPLLLIGGGAFLYWRDRAR